MGQNERLARIEQKLDDFIKAHATQHADLEHQLKGLTKLKNQVEQPVKWVGAMVVLSAAGVATYFGEKLGHAIFGAFKGH